MCRFVKAVVVVGRAVTLLLLALSITEAPRSSAAASSSPPVREKRSDDGEGGRRRYDGRPGDGGGRGRRRPRHRPPPPTNLPNRRGVAIEKEAVAIDAARIERDLLLSSSSGGAFREEDRAEYEREEWNFASDELRGVDADQEEAPSRMLRAIPARLTALLSLREATAAARRPLRFALHASKGARSAFYRGSSSSGRDDLSHLRRTALMLKRMQIHLRVARRDLDKAGIAAGAEAETETSRRVGELQESVAGVARRMAVALLERDGGSPSSPSGRGGFAKARARFDRGAAALAREDYVGATNHFGGALGLASNSLVFDVALFEERVKNALADRVLGYALSIAWQGQLYHGGAALGPARTANGDPPARLQSPAKEMHVVSVSKTLTTIVLLPLMELNGLTPDSTIAPYLPGDWDLGVGADDLTFRDLLTHRSGFGQISAGNTYAALRDAIGDDDRGSTSWCPNGNGGYNAGNMGFCYNNGNFALARVLTTRLLGIEEILGVDLAEMENPDVTTSAVFIAASKYIYANIGVGVNCRPEDDDGQTVQYNFPDGGASGYAEPDRRMECGGIGWHVSSNELAGILAYLRLTNDVLLSDTARGWMEEGFLGYMDPGNYGWIRDAFGTYYMHGGDWFHGTGEAHACAVAFPIRLQVGLVINSARRADMDYQCDLLQKAFEDAWVENG
mmetsp:Transcript_25602/g.75544  ORF Transcript_25602/g.75544 Transcript_25602/m.75544 type:complete len:680 (-) Transcript_25602:874-2913(-)